MTATFLLPALELLKEAIDKAGYTDKIVIGMDVAASEFYRDGKYDLDFKSPDDPSRYISADELGDLYQSFVRDYPGELLCFAVGNRNWCCILNRCILSVVLGWEGRQLSLTSLLLSLQWSPSRIPLTKMTGRPGPSSRPMWGFR